MPIPVTLRTARELWFFPERSATAEVVPLNDARLSAEIRARVLKIPVRVGQMVAAKTIVVQLDCRDTKASLGIALATVKGIKARLNLARTQLQRARRLKRSHAISTDALDRRQAEVLTVAAERAAQTASIVQARLQVNHCTLQAPFKGVVVERLASVGDLAAPGAPLLRLVQIDAAEVSARVNAAEVTKNSKITQLSFVWQQRTYPLRVLRVLPIFDARTRTQEMRLGFVSNTAPPGASGRLLWRSTTPYLPADLLVRRAEQLGVFLYDDGQVRFHPLPNAQEGQPASAKGLNPQASIILDGRASLHANSPVTVFTAQSGRSP